MQKDENTKPISIKSRFFEWKQMDYNEKDARELTEDLKRILKVVERKIREHKR